jgi:hypothetical protein
LCEYLWSQWPAPPDSPANNQYTDNGDGTITDSSTLLIWQKLVSGTHMWSPAQTYCEGLTLHQLSSGWRLPTMNELTTLVDYSQYSPAINQTVFPNTPTGYFWTSTPNATLSDYAWEIDFTDGSSMNVAFIHRDFHPDAHTTKEGPMSSVFKSKASSRWVVLVLVLCLAGFSVSRAMAPPGRYTYPDGTESSSMTVKDTVTGLTWQRAQAASTMNWDDAFSYCSGLSLVGKTGWRLPTVKELTSIVDFSVGNPAIDSVAFPGAQPTADAAASYWSNTQSAQPNLPDVYWWAVDFWFGTATALDTNHTIYVRCVTSQ